MAANSTTALPLDNPFWHYALRLYSYPGVEACCLALQGKGQSINRLLFCLWSGFEGRELPPRSPEADQWQLQISHPLRALRYQVREQKQHQSALDSCYAALRKAELACEQVEIAHLYVQSLDAATAEAGLELCKHNLRVWLEQQQQMQLWQEPKLLELLRLAALESSEHKF